MVFPYGLSVAVHCAAVWVFPQLLAHRIYVACVAQGCSTSLRPFGLMEQQQIARVDASAESDEDETKEDERLLKHKVGSHPIQNSLPCVNVRPSSGASAK